MSGCDCIHGVRGCRLSREDHCFGLRPGQNSAVFLSLSSSPTLESEITLPFVPISVHPLEGEDHEAIIVGKTEVACVWKPMNQTQSTHSFVRLAERYTGQCELTVKDAEAPILLAKLEALPGARIACSSRLPAQAHPWDKNKPMADVQELHLIDSDTPLTLPGGPYCLIDNGGSKEGLTIINVDDIAVLLMRGEMIEACMGEYRQCILAADHITPLWPRAPVGDKPSICVTMIVRNEEAIITRALERVKDLADALCICDTGSTDNTRVRCEEFLSEHKKPGIVFHVPFRDFGYNRTVSWLAGRGRATYQLFIDADHLLDVPTSFDKSDLTAPVYLLEQNTHGCSYWNLRLARDDGIQRCEGLTHEFWKPAHGLTPERLASLRITDIGDGGAKADKFTRDRALLERQLLYTPECSRTWFYLANTKRDQGENEAAIATYQKRIELGGWPEEVWNSYLNIGRCYKKMERGEDAVGAWLDAHEVDPTRLENLMDLVVHYRERKKYVLACRFCELALTAAGRRESNPRLLFVEESGYAWRLDYELSIIQFYLGAASQHLRPTVDRALWKLLRRAPLPVDHLISNHFFYATVLEPNASLPRAATETVKRKAAWHVSGPAPGGLFVITGWEDADGRTTMTWTQTGQSESVIGILPAPGCSPDEVRLVTGAELLLVMRVGGQIIGHTVWPEHRRLHPAFKIDARGMGKGLEQLALDNGRPHTIRSWFPYQVEDSAESTCECTPVPWRGVRPVTQCASGGGGTVWLLRLERSPDEALYALKTSNSKSPDKGGISRAFRFPKRESRACGLWLEKETVHLVGSTPAGHSDLVTFSIGDLEWMPISECV